MSGATKGGARPGDRPGARGAGGGRGGPKPGGGRGGPQPGSGSGRGRREPAALPLAELALIEALRFRQPADLVLRRFFAEHREMGRRDRAEVAELVFDVLRNRRLYASLAQSAGGSLPARMLALSRERAQIRTAGLAPEIRLSLPDWLYERLAARMPKDELESLGASMLKPAPLDLRTNLLKGDRDTALASLRSEGIDCEPSALAPLGIRVAGKPALERTRAFNEGLVEVQDCGSQLIALLCAPRRGQTVVDFCAGAGGKTLALAALLRGTGQIFACDVSVGRLQRLRPRLARSGASNVQPYGIDNELDPKLERLAGRADVVLVDAPCSGTGTLRRNPDLKWRMDDAGVAELTARQGSILAAAARLVRPGGALVYATCSLLDEENDTVRRAFEAAHPGWTVEPAGAVLSRQGVPESAVPPDAECLELRPDRHDTDAFYAVRWRRPA
ncbi:RsmB/NOP family class I SAM-dependent RNA methyltransferase [Quisquiliibacterium transsilvanicum]|uniref:16S rRNA (Cytosine967-C5)-methyltransferase n=1 Tax=Quisquiliibacterium transsilvanicum TaxID=1549638 RepID=A0A7W8HF04_9BURK|nr:RsmB/NOP family class I SAM-dependent RNA methyltransferase [Quisquiliibacterium transsilvanicum]MBB5270849.1 16S rRNA (cytosine967-C5)-methyltransferase [Quisquiliibacterium transsilvanicum]